VVPPPIGCGQSIARHGSGAEVYETLPAAYVCPKGPYGRGSRDTARRTARAPTESPISANSAAAWTAVPSTSTRPERPSPLRPARWGAAGLRWGPAADLSWAPAADLRRAPAAGLAWAPAEDLREAPATDLGALRALADLRARDAGAPAGCGGCSSGLRFVPGFGWEAGFGLAAGFRLAGGSAAAFGSAAGSAVAGVVGRAARFSLRRCGRVWGRLPRTSVGRSSLIAST
jgi:hypothetical protein